jgi:hypothetical protein
MGVKMRQLVEREICTAVVDALLAAGFSISVDNGDNSDREYEIANSTDKDAILKAMFLTDDEHLYVERNGKRFGWVYFVYGNDGYDVLSDNTINLEEYIGDHSPVQKLIDKYAD